MELLGILALELDWLLLRLAEARGGLLLKDALLGPGLAFRCLMLKEVREGAILEFHAKRMARVACAD